MRADERLEELGIDHSLVEQDRPTWDCAEAAEERGMEQSQIVKSLVVETGDQVMHVCLPGDRRLSGSKLGEYRLVNDERSEELTGQESGTVHPYSTDLKHLVDFRLFEMEELSHTAGTPEEAVVYRPEQFRTALEAADFEFEVRDLSEAEESDLELLESEGLERDDAKFVARSGMMDLFLKLEELDGDIVLTALREADRHGYRPEVEKLEGALEGAEGETHLQKRVESLAETGELPDEQGFDLKSTVSSVVEENPDAVEDYSNGKESALNYLLGQVMQRSSGRADPGDAREMILEELD